MELLLAALGLLGGVVALTTVSVISATVAHWFATSGLPPVEDEEAQDLGLSWEAVEDWLDGTYADEQAARRAAARRVAKRAQPRTPSHSEQSLLRKMEREAALRQTIVPAHKRRDLSRTIIEDWSHLGLVHFDSVLAPQVRAQLQGQLSLHTNYL